MKKYKQYRHLIFGLVALSIVVPAQAMGDLFTTVQQRTAIDVMREKGEVDVIDKVERVHSIEVNGFYFKNHDKRHQGTVWVNGAQVENTYLSPGLRLDGINEHTKTISLASDKRPERVPVKAGQKVIIGNGKILDAYQ